MEKKVTKSVIIDGIEYVPKEKKIESKNEYIFIIGTSGSILMENRMLTLEQILYSLQSNNKFNIIIFPDRNINKRFITAFDKSVPLNEEKIKVVMSLMNVIYIGRPEGESKLLPVIQRATKLPVLKGYERICIIITDEYILAKLPTKI